VPTPLPVNPPGDIPPPPPPSVAGAEVEIITPVEGGSVTLETTGTAEEPGRVITIDVPSSAVDEFVALDVAPVAAPSVPPVPAALRIRVSGTVVDLTFTDVDGNAIDDFVANRAITITISYTAADADEAGGAQNLVILKYDEVTEDWTALSTTVDLSNMTISASVKTFSLFGVGVPEVGEPAAAATATPRPPSEVTLPATGDVAPGNSPVIAFIVVGLLLMSGALIVIRRRQIARGQS
ncbi:MAG: LPXTG cell wall anchor domain-containing protein, partial [Chloroflexi bacterium]|nr:LPXTG cell wall anchor domain-containing protein [Chloroflexota bacterium]